MADICPLYTSRQAAESKGIGQAEIPYPQNNPQFRELFCCLRVVTLLPPDLASQEIKSR